MGLESGAHPNGKMCPLILGGRRIDGGANLH